MSIAANIRKIKEEIPAHVKLVAVSKTKPAAMIMEAYDAGQRVFGENKVQEMLSKHEALPKDIEWHMIGHLQRNKVKLIVPFVSLIHSADSLRLLETIDQEGRKCGRVIDCLLQVHIADEETKFGFDSDELRALFAGNIAGSMQFVRICGLMGMATFTEDEDVIRKEFRSLSQLFDEFREKHEHLSILSMGMSGDYRIAVEEGSTMIRAGSHIFGSRIIA